MARLNLIRAASTLLFLFTLWVCPLQAAPPEGYNFLPLTDATRQASAVAVPHHDAARVADTANALLATAPNLTVIWAHGGFDVDVNIIANKLKQNRNLYIELSFREGITDQEVLTPSWRELIMTHPSRFLIGTDTYTGQRWLALPELTDRYQGWLKQIPRNIAEAIAYKNGERIAAQKLVQDE